MPVQEPGTRPARPLPYEFSTQCRVEDGKLWIDFVNTGQAGTAFYAYNGSTPHESPRRYAVSASQKLSDFWEPSKEKVAYDLSIYGPNGYLSHFRGRHLSALRHASSTAEASVRYDRQSGDVYLTLTNNGPEPCTMMARNHYGNTGIRHYKLAPGATSEDRWPLASSSGWFDLSIAHAGDPIFLRRFAGHVETGRPGTSDPAIFLSER